MHAIDIRLWARNGPSGGFAFDCRGNGSTKTVLGSCGFSAGQHIFIRSGSGVNEGAVVFWKG
ncbi:MAG: hypothetical protein MR579_00310 [Bacteroidales bacterium]|nr:hypothetical protein [Bacteroidales bacterium]